MVWGSPVWSWLGTFTHNERQVRLSRHSRTGSCGPVRCEGPPGVMFYLGCLTKRLRWTQYWIVGYELPLPTGQDCPAQSWLVQVSAQGGVWSGLTTGEQSRPGNIWAAQLHTHTPTTVYNTQQHHGILILINNHSHLFSPLHRRPAWANLG